MTSGAPPAATPAVERAPHLTRAVRVLVIADVRMYREGLTAALRADAGVDVVAARGRPPPDLLALDPDIVLFDASRSDALQTVRDLLRDIGGAKVVVVAIPEKEGDLLKYAEAGVSGYVTCEQSVGDVIDAVKAVACGDMICTPRMAAALVRHVATLAASLARQPTDAGLPLTPREVEVVRLVEHGMTNRQISEGLQIEVATVKNHVHNILEKLQVQRRGEIAPRLRLDRPRDPSRQPV